MRGSCGVDVPRLPIADLICFWLNATYSLLEAATLYDDAIVACVLRVVS